MNILTLVVKQDVAIVAIFYLEQVAHQAVGGKTLSKVPLGVIEVLAEVISEELSKSHPVTDIFLEGVHR
jgi:hypothetical protein